jgi:hypothetical protein
MVRQPESDVFELSLSILMRFIFTAALQRTTEELEDRHDDHIVRGTRALFKLFRKWLKCIARHTGNHSRVTHPDWGDGLCSGGAQCCC